MLWLATASLASAQCVGDCDGDGVVAINELIHGVDMALAGRNISECPSLDVDRDGGVSIGELITAVRAALSGCSPTPSTTPTSTPTSSPTSTGFRICGKAGERPDPNPPLARDAVFTLEPLGTIVFSSPAGIFCFENVPPGSYTISVREYLTAPSHCTEYGCWETTPVTVIDSDILTLFIVMLSLPTPTP